MIRVNASTHHLNRRTIMIERLKRFFDMKRPAPLKWFIIGLIGGQALIWSLILFMLKAQH